MRKGGRGSEGSTRESTSNVLPIMTHPRTENRVRFFDCCCTSLPLSLPVVQSAWVWVWVCEIAVRQINTEVRCLLCDAGELPFVTVVLRHAGHLVYTRRSRRILFPSLSYLRLLSAQSPTTLGGRQLPQRHSLRL